MVNKITTPPTQNEVIDKINELVEDKTDWYGTCSTTSTTQEKVVVCNGFILKTGTSIRVKFTNAQSYNGQPKLNVNSTGAKNITQRGTTAGIRYMWSAGEVVSFTYDGTSWIWERGGIATTTYYGVTKLVTSAASASTSTALTPAALNNYSLYMVSGAPIYSATSTYAVGDRVRYGYYTYQCVTAITTEEAWTAEHWHALEPLQEQIDNKQDTISDLATIRSGATGNVKLDGGSSQQTISLTSGTGTTALGVTSKSTSSYISFSGSKGWLASFGILNTKKPVIYDGTSHEIAYTTDIPTVDQAYSETSTNAQSGVAVANAIALKQDTLVSGTNIKTINNQSLLGSGNIDIQGGGGSSYTAGDGIIIQNNVISVDDESVSEADTETVEEVSITQLLATITGYDATKTQSLKNVNGTLTWVTEV